MDLANDACEFRHAYGVPNNRELDEMQLRLITEEYNEFATAHAGEPDENTLKELADLVYVCFQYAENKEWDLQEALRRVHASNMSKLGKDGKPIRREDGKVLKGPNYKPADLSDLVKTTFNTL
jgi:NTP pyrophosphatase (non-canonical NTP hydrolase)